MEPIGDTPRKRQKIDQSQSQIDAENARTGLQTISIMKNFFDSDSDSEEEEESTVARCHAEGMKPRL